MYTKIATLLPLKNTSALTAPFTSMKNARLFFILSATILSLLLSLLAPLLTRPASAAPTWSGSSFIADEVYKNTSGHQHYYWLYACFRHVDIDKVTPSEMDGWDFFERNTNSQALGAMYSGESSGGNLQGLRDCQTQSIVKTAFGYLGFDEPREAFCSLKGAKYRDDHSGNYDDCIAGVGDHDWDNDEDEDVVAKSFEDLAKSKKPSFGGAEEYVRAYSTLVSERGCKIKFNDTKLYTSSDDVPGAGDSSSQYAVPVFVKDDAENGYVLRYIQGVGIPNGDSNLAYVATTSGDYSAYQKKSCNQIVELARDNAAAYKAWLASHPDATGSDTTDQDDDNDDEEPGEETTCAIDGIGWIVCPVMTFVGKMNDAAFGFLEGILGIRPAIITSESTQSAWSAFRDIANVMFVIAFMIIVYSQITSAGLSNYGIKKMLPRIVVAAILVNASYIICALAVDVSNIVGSSVYTLLKDSIASDVGGEITTTAWEDSISKILGIAATAIGVILLVVALFMAPAVLIAFALIILILIARQALVILLIVIAPLAFVAYLLPNTEDWFKKWQKAFTVVLMVYPIVGLVFGASTLASQVLMSVAQAGDEDEQLLQLVALGVLAVPLFAVPAILKGSLSAAGSIGTKIAGLADRSTRMSGKQFGDRASGIKKDLGNRFNIAAHDPENKLGRRLGGYSRFKTRRDMGKRDRETAANRSAELGYATNMIEKDANGEFTNRALRLQKAAAGGVGVANEKGQVRAEALATQRTFKQFDDDVSAFKTTQTNDTHGRLLQKAGDMSLSVEERSAAAGSIAGRSFRAGHNEVLEQSYNQMKAADTELRAAEASGDQAKIASAQEQVGTASAIQKQLIGDLKEKPFALGDRAMGQLGEGKFGRATIEKVDKDGKPVLDENGQQIYEALLSPREEMRHRVETKLNAQTVATMNPDDLNLIYDDAMNGGLNDGQMSNLVKQIAAARANNDTAVLIKPEASSKFDKIIEKATERGLMPEPTAAPSAQTQNPAPSDSLISGGPDGLK